MLFVSGFAVLGGCGSHGEPASNLASNLASNIFSQLSTYLYPSIIHIVIYLYSLLNSLIHFLISHFERKLPFLFEHKKHSNNNPETGHHSTNRYSFYTLLYRLSYLLDSLSFNLITLIYFTF